VNPRFILDDVEKKFLSLPSSSKKHIIAVIVVVVIVSKKACSEPRPSLEDSARFHTVFTSLDSAIIASSQTKFVSLASN
jgi:hypothetical protein